RRAARRQGVRYRHGDIGPPLWTATLYGVATNSRAVLWRGSRLGRRAARALKVGAPASDFRPEPCLAAQAVERIFHEIEQYESRGKVTESHQVPTFRLREWGGSDE